MTTDTKAVARYIPTSSHGGMVRVEGSGDGTYVSDADHARVVAELRAEIDGLVKDAGRYRWLRDTPWTDDCEVAPVIQMQMNSLWDKTIDAAMKEQAE